MAGGKTPPVDTSVGLVGGGGLGEVEEGEAVVLLSVGVMGLVEADSVVVIGGSVGKPPTIWNTIIVCTSSIATRRYLTSYDVDQWN